MLTLLFVIPNHYLSPHFPQVPCIAYRDELTKIDNRMQ